MSEYELIKELFWDLGLWFGFGMFLIIIGFTLVMFYIKNKIVSDLDEKTRIKIEELDKKLEVMFRDEGIRKKLTVYAGKKSIDSKIKIFSKVSKDYTLLKDAFRRGPTVPEKMMNDLIKRYEKTRDSILINSIFLGGEYSELVAKIGKNILASLHERRYKDTVSKNPSNDEVKKSIGLATQNILNRDKEIQKLFLETRNYLIKKLYTDQDIKRYNFNEEQNKSVESSRDEFIATEFKEKEM